MQSIYPFIYRRTVILHGDTPAQDAAKAMSDNHIGCVLVTDFKGRIVGIVTDRDFTSRLAADYAVTTIALSQIMTPSVVTATSNSKLVDIINLMETHGIRRVPLVEPGPALTQKCVGIITLDDLIASKLIDVHQLSRIVQRQIGRRILARGGAPHTGRAELRSVARSQQVLSNFYEKCAKNTGLPESTVTEVVNFLLESLAMRLSFTGATHLAAQLPKAIQDLIFTLSPGPDRSITAERLQRELVVRFKFTDGDARLYLHKFFSGLESLITAGEVQHIQAQLPQDLLELFTSTPDLGSKTAKLAANF